jgi:predicted Zn-dependent protease
MVRSLLVVFLLGAGTAYADVPVTGRTQHFTFSREQVQDVAAQAYRVKLARLRERGELDADRKTLIRVRRIAAHLIAQAIELKPNSAGWRWDVHVASSPDVAAFSMAGGKLLIGSQFIRSNQLTDQELSVAIAHEIGHVIAEHVREQLSMAAEFDPAPPGRTLGVRDVVNSMDSDIAVYLRLQPLSRLQELEADDIGVQLAARSGVSPAAIKSFYGKITRKGVGQTLFDTHGPVGQRREFAMSMADFAESAYEKSQEQSLPTYAFRQ